MKRTYITLQILIAAKMNAKNNEAKKVNTVTAVATHHIF